MWLRRLWRSDGSGGLCRADRAAAYSPSQPLATLTRTSHQQALGRAGGVAAGFIGQRGRGRCGLPVLQGARRNFQQPTTSNQQPTTNTKQHPTQHPTQHPHVISTSRSTSSHTLYPLSRSRSHLLMRPSRCATRSHSSPPPSPTPRPTGSARCSARPRAARHRSACGWCAPHRCAVTHRGGPA